MPDSNSLASTLPLVPSPEVTYDLNVPRQSRVQIDRPGRLIKVDTQLLLPGPNRIDFDWRGLRVMRVDLWNKSPYLLYREVEALATPGSAPVASAVGSVPGFWGAGIECRWLSIYVTQPTWLNDNGPNNIVLEVMV